MRGSKSEPGDTHVAKNGYHYTRTEDKWRLTHHIIAESNLGRPLSVHERAVFKDNDRTNLDPGNIVVRRKTTASLRTKEKNLVEKISQLQAELDAVRNQIQKNLTFGEEDDD